MSKKDGHNYEEYDDYDKYEDYYNDDDKIMPSHEGRSPKWRRKEKERTVKIRKARKQKKQQYEM